jgi:predicted DCC family thiol-disulfide oxidoreductase YuxK
MQPVLLFDGVCNLCNALVRFVIRQDKKQIFRFASLQSSAGQRLLAKYKIDWKRSDSFVLIENERAFQQSGAALRLCKKLPWYWSWTQLFWIIPPFLREALYRVVARNRYNWFGRQENCMVPTEATKARFLE